MIIKIAFKNIWRNKLRSLVVMLAIALGIFGGLAVISTARGLTKMRQDNAIKSYVSHIQLHDSNYLTYGRISDVIEDSEEIVGAIRKDNRVQAVTERIRLECFVQSAGGNSGVILNGIVPEQEKQVTNLSEQCEEGNFLEVFKRKPPIVISRKLADKLNAKIKTTIQCSFAAPDGTPVALGFKLVDIYTTSNSMYDEVNAFVRIEDLQSLTGLFASHEIALILKNDDDVSSVKTELTSEYPSLQVESWRGIAPELGYADRMMDLVMTLFLIIIMLALAFGIINTMLMAVLERRKELGMLISVGMNKRKVFRMIIWESVFLALLAGPVGIIVSFVSIEFFNEVGIDLSFAADGLRSVGLGSTIFPYLDARYYLIISILVITTAILSSIYPAIKALKLNPAETLRTSV